MAWMSTTPAAIDGLVAALRGASSLNGAVVFDGPTVSEATWTAAVVVGYGDDDTPTAVDGTLDIGGLGGSPDREQYTIQCVADVINGAGDIATARAGVFNLFAGIGEAIAADRTLGGAVMQARLSQMQFQQSQTKQGAFASISFGVSVDAFTRR